MSLVAHCSWWKQAGTHFHQQSANNQSLESIMEAMEAKTQTHTWKVHEGSKKAGLSRYTFPQSQPVSFEQRFYSISPHLEEIKV